MLVGLGAQHIIVLSRSGMPQSGKPLASVEGWRSAGVEIEAYAVDMANYDQLNVNTLPFSYFFTIIVLNV